MKRVKTLMIAAMLTIGSVACALAGEKAVYAGGDGGAYKSLFCPPIPTALDKAYFKGYSCAKTKGTTDNMDLVLANPSGLGLAEMDVFARRQAENPAKYGKLVAIREVACEGLWMVTKNSDVTDYGRVLGYAKRINFVVAPGGSADSFKYLQANDPDGLGRAPASRVHVAESTEAMLSRVEAGREGEVGYFVQFADPTNKNIRRINESGLHIVPVVSRSILGIKSADGKEVYQAQTFSLTEGGFFKSSKTATTACTPAVIFAAKPEVFTDKTDAENQQDLIKKIGELPDDAFLPKQSAVASIIRGAKKLGGAALEEMTAATDLARKKIEDYGSK